VSSEQLQTLIEKIAYEMRNPQLLEQALTHKSYRHENEGLAFDNERLEFLGDAVIDLALSELLMSRFSGDQEGSLSKKRASLVNEDHLAQLARDLQIDQHLRLGKGERLSGGLQRPRLLAAAFEAVIGAIFLDGGYSEALRVIESLFAQSIAEFQNGVLDYARDYKTRLQELAQEKFRLTPTYTLESQGGPDHDKTFEVSVRLENKVIASGRGRNKKMAEQDAARVALDLVNQGVWNHE